MHYLVSLPFFLCLCLSLYLSIYPCHNQSLPPSLQYFLPLPPSVPLTIPLTLSLSATAMTTANSTDDCSTISLTCTITCAQLTVGTVLHAIIKTRVRAWIEYTLKFCRNQESTLATKPDMTTVDLS